MNDKTKCAKLIIEVDSELKEVRFTNILLKRCKTRGISTTPEYIQRVRSFQKTDVKIAEMLNELGQEMKPIIEKE